MQNIRVQERRRSYFNFGRPSLFPAIDFNAEKDAKEILTAFETSKTSLFSLKSNPVNTNAVAKLLGRRNADQRYEIKEAFNKISSTKLEDYLKKKLPKDSYEIMLDSIKSTDEYLANELNDALKGKLDKEAVYEIVLGLSNYEIEKLKNKFQEMFKKDLVTTIKAVYKDGMSKEFLVQFLAGTRPEPLQYEILLQDFASMVDLSKVAKDASFIAEKALKSPEAIEVVKLFCHRTKPELRACFEEMYQHDENGFIGLVEKNISKKDLRDEIKTIGFALAYPEEFFADRLYKTMKGLGTNDRNLRRICLMRSEVDMDDIKLVYRFIRNTELIKDIEGDTSGEYMIMLSSMIGV